MFDLLDFSNWHFYLLLIISFINAFILCFAGYKFLQIIQLSGYHTRGYFDWLKTSGGVYVGRLAMVTVLSSAFFVVTDVILYPYNEYLAYIGLLFYVLFSAVYFANVYDTPQKTPLKMTNRMNRAMILLWVLGFVLTFGLLFVSEMFIPYYSFLGLALTPLFLPCLVPFVHICLKPMEKLISNNYLKKARKKLELFPDLIKIGITGSFGKTSTKNFLATILSEKYNTCATPFNFNTPMGITRTVLQNLDLGAQVFVAEMGARQMGDIKELCELVKPQYGILTAVGAQHIATFANVENVKKTKAELPVYLGKNGVCVFDMDNEFVREIANASPCKKIKVSLVDSSADVFASEINTTDKGTTFKLHFNKKTYDCSTKLLGLHNISNMLLCVGLAVQLNLTDDEILKGIARIVPVEHRLQLINAENNITILDDTYNSSIDGSKRALEVLSMFKERRKIVITPGLVELGTIERLENYNFGARISKVADIVVIVNKTHLASIKQGLLDNDFDSSKIYEAESLLATQTMLKDILLPNDVILWENDLPDNYI